MPKRLLCILSALMLLGAIAPGLAGAQPAKKSSFTVTPLEVKNTVEGAKSPTSRLAQTDRGLLGKTSSKPVNVMVKLDYDSAATYTGGVRGLRATSPEFTGRSLEANAGALNAYKRYAAEVEGAVLDRVRSRIDGATVQDRYRIAYGGVAMRLPLNQVDELLATDGVVAVQRDTLAQPQTDASPEFIGATEAWRSLGGSRTAGEGVIVGVLDTGIWPEHDSFIDPGIAAPEGEFGCEFGDGTDPALGDPFECNDKLIGAYAFTDTYMSVIDSDPDTPGNQPALPGEFCNNETLECSARDPDGHGTHTSSTAAGSGVDSAPLFDIERGPISGIAPGAHVIMYRVCLAQGCFGSDSVAAVEQAIVDGVDVINFSISGGSEAFSDPVELAFLDAYASGTLVNASAGNSGPGAATADHAGPWTNTVGASTSDRHFITSLEMDAANGDTLSVEGVTITPGIEEFTPVVRAGDVEGYEEELCLTPLPEGSVEGQIVFCQRGEIGRNEKSFNVMQGGAAGMVLYNTNNEGLNTDNFWVPTVHIEGPEPADRVIDFIESHDDVQAHFDTGTPTQVRGDVMTSFSSRGPLGDFIKPDVTAPGIQILAGNTPEPINVAAGPPGQFYQAIAGTSMSSPHSAGVSALVKAAHPGWTPGEIKSALMTSSLQDVLKEDGSTPADPFDRGAGSIRANRALSPTLLFDVPAGDYYAAAADPLHRIDLNLPSINAPEMSGQVTTERTVRNVSGRSQRLTARIQAPEGASITVSPSRFTVQRGSQRTFTVTINGENLSEGQYFGQITLDPQARGSINTTIPVAFRKTDPVVSLSHSCSPRRVPVDVTTTCSVTASNLSSSDASGTINVTGPDGVSVRNPEVVAGDRQRGGVQPIGNGFRWGGRLDAALPPTVAALEAGGQPYVSLASLGAEPLGPLGDEELVNLTIEGGFTYGSESYDTIALVSNGYAVVGGGTSQDIECCNLQDLPDPAAPNNLLAPWWTDLNPEEGGDVYATTLSDSESGRSWIVLEWDGIPEFGDTTDVQTFQIWIETTPPEDDEDLNDVVSFAYDTVAGDGDAGVGLVAGAENRDGTSGAQLEAPPVTGDEFTVLTSPPTAGGSVTINYDATGTRTGNFRIPARMTTDVTVGTTTAFAGLEVRAE